MITPKNRQALSKAMAICSKSEKCIFDIQKKLDAWEISPANAQEIIEQLIEEKFIDEERFTRYYVRDKFRFNKWGKQKLTYMLKGKRIPEKIIKKELAAINLDEYNNMLLKLIQEKACKVKFKNEFDKKSKLIRFAQGRGFEYDAINKAISLIE
jgi:regulatory protein